MSQLYSASPCCIAHEYATTHIFFLRLKWQENKQSSNHEAYDKYDKVAWSGHDAVVRWGMDGGFGALRQWGQSAVLAIRQEWQEVHPERRAQHYAEDLSKEQPFFFF
jgi:hypothetical protein